MDISSFKQAQKLTYIINGLLTLFVLALIGVFKAIGAIELFYITICALCYYLIAFVIIAKKKLDVYLISVYVVITLFMCCTTVFLGIKTGFQMYILSMIPLFYFCDYFAEKLGTRRVKALLGSLLIGAAYALSTAYAIFNGPVYEVNEKVLAGFFAINSIWVIGLLIVYSASMIQLVRSSEGQLRRLVQMDKLTGVYNRHFMIRRLEEIHDAVPVKQWIAILDVDNFKIINDTFGHNAGDKVLMMIADCIRNICGECEYARWGGEEFVITADRSKDMEYILESLRRTVDETTVTYDSDNIHVTITIGACICDENEKTQTWIQQADRLLYQGKNSGKNCVVIDKSVK